MADAEQRRPAPAYAVGLDLGQAADFTALAVGELVPASPFEVHVRHMERYPLRTPYPDMVASVQALIARLRPMGRVLLIVDHTGVGRPVVDMFRAAQLKVPIWPVTIATSAMGQARRDEAGDWTVPKKDLVGALQSLMHTERLKIAKGLKEARTLQQELVNFRMKITAAANLTYESWREGDKDDLVLAVAMACWAAQRWASPGGLI